MAHRLGVWKMVECKFHTCISRQHILMSGEGPQEGENVRSLLSEENHGHYGDSRETCHLEVAVGPSPSGFPSFIPLSNVNSTDMSTLCGRKSMAPSPKVMRLLTRNHNDVCSTVSQ